MKAFSDFREDVLKEIVENLSNIGTIIVTVHNGDITQLDVTKKKRFDRVETRQVIPKLSRK